MHSILTWLLDGSEQEQSLAEIFPFVIYFRFALLSLNKIVQVLPALLLTGIYGHDTPFMFQK